MESAIMENDNNYLNKIREGDFVIMKKLHDKTFGRLLQIDLNVPFLIGKTKFDISNLIGKEYGSIYTVNNKNKCLDYVDRFEKLFNFKSTADDNNIDKDNRFFKDDNKSQKLTHNEINKIKEDGRTTKEIIETLVENSSTFNQKTIYSQEKYLKKKQEKYSNFMRIYKPNPILLCDMWFNQGAYKTCGLRIDSLAHLLNLCNVRSGCKYMVVDAVNGLVSASVLERLIGDCSIFNQSKADDQIDVGKCVQIYLEQGPLSTWRYAINALNYKEEHLNQCLLSVQIHKTASILKSSSDEIKNDKKSINQLDQQQLNDEEFNDDMEDESIDQQQNDKKLNQKRKPIDDNEFQKNKRIKLEEKQLRKKKRLAEEQIALELLSKKNFDGLIVIARNHNISEIVDHLLNFLSPSAQFVVFSNYIESLTECYSKIRHKTCNLKLNDIWMRNYQVLPMRTRPDMEMFGKSGYILHGINLDVQ